MSVEAKAAERLENLRKQHGGICTPYACDICWLLEQLDQARDKWFIPPSAERQFVAEAARWESVKYRRRLWIRFMWGVLAGSAVTAIILVSQVWWLDIGRHLF